MSAPTVEVKQGHLRGRIADGLNGQTYYSFQGIPFAKPPLGNLRFKDPQPAEPWDGVRDALIEGQGCYCRDLLMRNVSGSEDCLFLNVYTPTLPTKAEKVSKPVMVWVHGGGFVSGSGNTFLYGPEFLVREDVVIVTLNYRVGILGFLSLEDPTLEVPGNAGMKDQVLALKWVQENIEQFGGDPNNVTLFGESAGGASVHYLLLSPLTKGLFHRVILQSGCALNPFALSRNVSSELAEILELKEATEKNILAQLIDLSTDKLIEVGSQITRAKDVIDKVPYAPIVEHKHEGAFITEHPAVILKSGNYHKVPLIFGYTTREGMLFELLIRPLSPVLPEDFEQTVPYFLDLPRGSDTSKAIAAKIKAFYSGASADEIDNFYLLGTDNYFIRDILFSAKSHVRSSSLPVYLYRMSLEAGLNILKNMANITAPGVCHGDDLGYLWKNKFSPEPVEGSLEDISVKRFTKLWTNFAKFGDPNGQQKDNLLPVQWKPVDKNNVHFLDIGTDLTVGTNPENERMRVWDEILAIKPLYTLSD